MIEESCPTCGGSGRVPVSAEGLEVRVAELRAWLEARGVEIGPGDTVTSAVAARVLNVEEQTLRADRAVWGRIPFQRVCGELSSSSCRELIETSAVTFPPVLAQVE
jgi:hypothetical protein